METFATACPRRSSSARSALFAIVLSLSVATQVVGGCTSPGDDDDVTVATPTPTVSPAPIDGLVEIVAPFAGQVVATEGLDVYLRTTPAVDLASLQVLLDGVDVTGELNIDATTRTARASRLPLKTGQHRLEVHSRGIEGTRSLDAVEFSAFPGFAIAKQIEQAQELVEGPESRGRLGDFALYNGRIQLVFSNLGRPFDFMNVYGGHLLDADRVRPPWEAERDALGGIVPAINIESTDNPTTIEVVNDGRDGNPAVIRTRGPDDPMASINPSTMAPLLIPEQLSGTSLVTFIPESADDKDLPLEITNTYTLAPGDAHVTFETTVKNVGNAPVSLYIGDYMNSSGEVDYFSPGQGFRQSIYFRHEGQLMAYAGFGGSRGLAYGLIPEIQPTTTISLPGTILSFMGQDAQNVVLTGEPPKTSIAPGKTFTYRRWWVVGENVADVTGVRCSVASENCGKLSGRVTQEGKPIAGAEVAVVQPGGINRDRTVITHWRTGEDGTYSGDVPAGVYNVMANVPNAPYPDDSAMPPTRQVNIRPTTPAEADFSFEASGLLEVDVIDESGLPIPARITLVGFDPSQDPLVHGLVPVGYDDTGAVFADVFMDPMPYGVARVALAGADGRTGQVAVEPGDYQLVVSRGPFYSLYKERVAIPPGPEVVQRTVQLARVIRTHPFVSGDFHVHGIDSFDSSIPRDFRLTGLAAEDVNVFAATEHGIHVDFTGDLARLGLSEHVVGLVAEEMTTMDLGHFNAFPLDLDPASRTGGAMDWAGRAEAGKGYTSAGTYDLSLSEIAERFSANSGEQVLLVNHPNTTTLGYFSLIGLDTGKQPPTTTVPSCLTRQDPAEPLWTANFTAVELWRTYEDSSTLLWDENLGDWFNLLNQGLIRTSTSDSDTHSRFIAPAGGPRNLLPMGDDVTFNNSGMGLEVAKRMQEGRLINTNAPFLQVELEALSTGARAGLAPDLPLMVQAADGRVRIHVQIESALWAPFDQVEVYINNAPVPEADNDDAPGRTYPFSNCAGSEVSLPDVPRYSVRPDFTFSRDEDFTVESIVDFPSIPNAGHLEALLSFDLALTSDSWVVVLVRGSEGVSEPLFPVMPDGILEDSNTSLEDLLDGNVGEGGTLATAFINPLFVDVDGNGSFNPPGVRLASGGRFRLEYVPASP